MSKAKKGSTRLRRAIRKKWRSRQNQRVQGCWAGEAARIICGKAQRASAWAQGSRRGRERDARAVARSGTLRKRSLDEHDDGERRLPVASEPKKFHASFVGSDTTDERNEKMRDGERGHRAGSRWTNECLCHGAKRVFVKFSRVN